MVKTATPTKPKTGEVEVRQTSAGAEAEKVETKKVEVKPAQFTSVAAHVAGLISKDSNVQVLINDMARLELGRDPQVSVEHDAAWQKATQKARDQLLEAVAKVPHAVA